MPPTGESPFTVDATWRSLPIIDESPWRGVGWLLGGAALFNFMILLIARGVEGGIDLAAIFFVSVGVGVYAAELGLATLCLVCGPGPFWQRLLIHWSVAFGLYIVWAIGFGVAFASVAPPGGVPQVWGAVLCGLPLVSLAAQLPLWPLRIYLGWRVEQPDHNPAAERTQSLSIRDLLAGTVVTSVSLAALRLMPEEFNRGAEFWLDWAIAFVSIMGISAISLLPAMVFLCRMRETAAGATAWFGYTGIMLIVTLVIISSLAGRSLPGEVFAAAAVIFYSFAGALSLPLFIARARGLRLTFPADRRMAPAPEVKSLH